MLTFTALGPFQAWADGTPLDLGGQRQRAVLARLIVAGGRAVPVNTLIDELWPGEPPAQALSTIQGYVSRLRRVLEPRRAPREEASVLVSAPPGYALRARPDQVDAWRFESLAKSDGAPAEIWAAMDEALALWRGPALAGLSGDLIAADAARLESRRLAVAEDRVEAELRLGRHSGLLEELSGLLAAHPLRERLHGLRMRVLYESGRRVEALAAYESARRTFRDELGAEPSPGLAELHLTILRAVPGHRGSSPSAAPGETPEAAAPRGGPGADRPPEAARRRGNLRARLTSFVGREEDLRHTARLLAGNRLVTLVGPGGAGKTRLALEIAEAVEPDTPDGVWLVELAAAQDAAEVVRSLVGALGIRDAVFAPMGGAAVPREPLDRLTAALRDRRPLVVLDNCEHVVEHAALVADRLLADCPGVRVLATSREPLGITGEVTWALPPLGLPPADASPGQAAAYPAVRLFADRAAGVRPSYRVGADAGAVAAICRALDGMPLAIELAAARLRSLTAQEIAARLGDRFRLLSSGSRTAQPRHQTLRAVVEWSWNLLDEQERTLGRRLSVFAGGATLATIEHLYGDVLDPLARLVDKSFVVFDGGRYRMLETIRAYAAERLAESGELDAVWRAHAHWFTRLAETAEPGLRTGEQLDRLAELTAEHENLAAALRWAVGGGDAELGLRLVGALGWYWWLRGHRAEAAARAREALSAAGPDADGAARAVALVVYVLNGYGTQLTWEESRQALEETRRLGGETPSHPLMALAGPLFVLYGSGRPKDEALVWEMDRHTDPWVVATGRLLRGLVHYASGRLEDSERESRAALDAYRVVGDRWGTANACSTLSNVYFLRGESERGLEVMKGALELVDELGSVEDTAYMRAQVVLGLNLLGRREEAERLLHELTRTIRDSGDEIGEAGVAAIWGEFHRQDGDLEGAREHFARARALMERVPGAPIQMVSAVNTSVALAAVHDGDLPRARRLLALALEQATEGHDAQLIGIVVISCAAVAMAAGRPEDAAALLGGAETIKGSHMVVDHDHVRITADAVAALGEREFARHRERGRLMSQDEIVGLGMHV
ncbi:BTAD domain-containing putative transcriptional regulator [Nonomuraea sp. MCN248]|uniref:BTAD domain-containing putative transcriptional regulator n=1 Tax=Nonomuraea corallina TaxID=2989783 RepID=A0ABT4S743_9ACTN|nr:BTAD domain-containing putative transcriptional regulator [Nonomuraea corallina]MDA0633042.1 BTAD domain-containing putative transcriptional regulator [Nonomuraea corallina]